MVNREQLILLSLATAIVAPSAGIGAAFAQQSEAVRVSTSEGVLRRNLDRLVHPTFPSESVRQGHQGVVVSEVEFTPDGIPDRVSILAAPDGAIAESVRSAVALWRLRVSPTNTNRPTLIAKATYYFWITNGRGEVYDPESAPLARERRSVR